MLLKANHAMKILHYKLQKERKAVGRLQEEKCALQAQLLGGGGGAAAGAAASAELLLSQQAQQGAAVEALQAAAAAAREELAEERGRSSALAQERAHLEARLAEALPRLASLEQAFASGHYDQVRCQVAIRPPGNAHALSIVHQSAAQRQGYQASCRPAGR